MAKILIDEKELTKINNINDVRLASIQADLILNAIRYELNKHDNLYDKLLKFDKELVVCIEKKLKEEVEFVIRDLMDYLFFILVPKYNVRDKY